MGFSRQKYWSGLPFPSPRDLPEPGIKPASPILLADSLPPQASSIVHRTWTGNLFHTWYFTCFNAILPNLHSGHTFRMDYWIKVLEHSARGVVTTWSQYERSSPSSDKSSAGEAPLCRLHHCGSSPGEHLLPGIGSENLLKGYMNVSGQCKLVSIPVLIFRLLIW